MEWEKAKNIVIIFLIALNVMLGVLIGFRDKKYVLSAEQEQNINSVLLKNNISLECLIDKDFSPMRRIELEYYDFDYEVMVNTFFRNTHNVRERSADGRIEFNNEDEYLYVGRSLFNYDYYGDGEPIEFTVENAEKICDEFIDNMGDLGKGYVIDISPYVSKDRIIAEYRQEFKGYKIYNNYIKFYISEMGIRSIEYSYAVPEKFVENPREICSPDEALFTFMRWAERFGQNSIIIDDMDIVYCWSDSADIDLTAYPCYRIYFFNNDMGERQSLIIDAYLNSII